MDRSSFTDMTLLKKEQKDADLDKRIEAMRKKNEALIKRYQEVEEDKKRAEQEGMAMHSRKSKVEDLTITINKSPTEKRVVTKKSLGDTVPKGVQKQENVSNVFIAGRGKRRQILVTAPGNTKGKRVVSEKVEKSSYAGLAGIKPSTEGRTEPPETSARRTDCLNSQVGLKQDRKYQAKSIHHGLCDYNLYPQQVEVLADLSIPSSSEEKLEYLRWKKEREEIDRERVARHKNSHGQWRRAWDLNKPKLTFSEKGTPERGSRGERNTRRGRSGPSATELRGGQRDKRGKNVPFIGSKVKGKDRLTGRARRWYTKEEAENLEVTPGTSLEEFLEELDALCNPEVNSRSPDTEAQKAEFSSSVKIGTTTSYVSIPTKSESQIISIDAPKNTSSFREAEKKVRFSDDLIQGAYKKNSNTDANDVKASTFKSLPPTTTVSEEQDVWQDLNHDHEGILLTDPRSATPSIKELEHRTKSKSEDSPCASVVTQNSTEVPNIPTDQNLLYTKEPLENNTSINTDELMDSSLSVLSLESTESLPVYSTSTEKARENGKVV